MAKAKKPFAVETALGELEALIARMESGELSLEDSLKAFEEGIRLTRECQEALTQAEQKVQLLLSEKGDCAPFTESSESAAAADETDGE